MGRLLLLAAAISLLGACVHRGAARTAEDAVHVEAIRAHFTPGDRARFELELSVASPGLQAGALVGMDYEIWLGNRWFAAGTQQLAEPLPDRGRHRFTVEVPVVFRRTVAASGEATAVEVGVRGGVMAQSAGERQRLPFQHREWLQVENAPGVLRDLDEP